MELATVAAQARDLAEFLKLFSERVAGMLSAEWCGVVVIRGQDAELEVPELLKFDIERKLASASFTNE